MKVFSKVSLIVLFAAATISCNLTSGPEDVSYTITYNLNGGEFVEGYVAPQSYTAKDEVLLPGAEDITKADNIFYGWFDTEEFYDEPITGWSTGEKEGNVVLYANFDNPSYTVRHLFQKVEGDEFETLALYPDVIKCGPEGEMTSAQALTAKGFTALDFEQAEIKMDCSTVIEIKYKRNTYTLSYSDGDNEETLTVPASKTYRYGQSVNIDFTAIPNAEKFMGWQDTENVYIKDKTQSLVMPAEDLELLPLWNEMTRDRLQELVNKLPMNTIEEPYKIALVPKEKLSWEDYSCNLNFYTWFGNVPFLDLTINTVTDGTSGKNETFPSSVSIESNAIVSVTISSGVISVSCGYNENIRELNIPDSTTDLTINNCPKLKTLTIDKNNEYFSFADGILYNKDKTNLKKCIYLESENYVIPNGVKEIGQNAFSYCQELKGITIPSSVTDISSSAFNECRNLKSIIIPDSVTYIGSGAFNGCLNLESITLPASLTEIPDNCFSHTKIKSIQIPKTVTFIGDNAFSNCSELETINLPDSISVIPVSCFSGTKIKSIQIPETVTSIGSSAFSNCTELESINLPSSLTEIPDYCFSHTKIKSIQIPETVTSIGSYAFSNCTELESIAIPSNVTQIADSTFSDCSKLKSITIPNTVTAIESFAFSGCTSLERINLPAALTEISYHSFSNSGLKQLNIPESVEIIREDAFLNCKELKKVTLPSSLKTIEQGAFSGCPKLEISSASNENFTLENSFLMNKEKTVLHSYFGSEKTVTVPETISKIDEYAFSGNTLIENISLPDNITSIGYQAFMDCSNLRTITIPEGITELKWGIFYGCTKLNSVYLPSTLETIEDGAFKQCINLQNIVFPKNMTSTSLTLEEECFACCTKLEKIVLPNIELSWDSGAFYICTGLKSIVLPEQLPERISDDIFYMCINLEKICYRGTKEQWDKIEKEIGEWDSTIGIASPSGSYTIVYEYKDE